jgi:class 3 adenylate cyclase
MAEPGRGAFERSEELRAITERLWAANTRGDLEAILAGKSQLCGVTLFGPYVGEFIEGGDHLAEYIRLLFADDPAGFPQLGPPEIAAWAEGGVGWSISRVPIERAGVRHEQRITLVFHLERGDWRVVHEHWSFGSTDAAEEAYGMTPARTLELLSEAAARERPDLRQWASPEGTVTLVFTDIQGSTALNAAFGDRAWLQVLRAHNRIVEEATASHAGRVVKALGDGFMLAFGSARRALACAQAIDRRISETFDDPGSPVRVRIGVHVGEVVGEGGDLFGHAVSYAARVAAAASGGEILASSLVHDLVERTGDFVFGPARTVDLKGIEGAVRLHPLAASV